MPSSCTRCWRLRGRSQQKCIRSTTTKFCSCATRSCPCYDWAGRWRKIGTPSSLCSSLLWERGSTAQRAWRRSEEHTSELQSHSDIVCRLLLEKKKKAY